MSLRDTISVEIGKTARLMWGSILLMYLVFISGFIIADGGAAILGAMALAGVVPFLYSLAYGYRHVRCPQCARSIWKFVMQMSWFGAARLHKDFRHCPFCGLSFDGDTPGVTAASAAGS